MADATYMTPTEMQAAIEQLKAQQSLQSDALAALLADHYADGPASAKGLLVRLNPDKYRDLAVVEKQSKANAPPAGGVTPIWKGSPNHWPDGLTDVVAIVVHTMDGSLSSTDSWFGNPASQVSAHYGAGLGGELHQYVALSAAAWANGRLEPGNHWQERFGSENPNRRTISIETEDHGDPHQPVTDAQYATVLAAGRLALAEHAGIQVVTSHHVISPSSRPNCCGARWIASGRLAQLGRDLGRGVYL